MSESREDDELSIPRAALNKMIKVFNINESLYFKVFNINDNNDYINKSLL